MNRFQALVRRELVYLCLGVMEVCVLTPLLAAAVRFIVPVEPLEVTLIFLAVLLGIHYLTRLLLSLPLRPLLRSLVFGLAMVASGLAFVQRTFHAEMSLWDGAWLVRVFENLQQGGIAYDVLAFLFVVFFWWRGIVLAQRRLDSESVAFRFRLGVVLLAITTLVGGLILQDWPIYHLVFVFFFASLLGIALARAEEVGHQYGGYHSPFNLEWLLTLVAAALLVLGLAAGAASILTGRVVVGVWQPIRIVVEIIFRVFVYAASWIAFAVTSLLLAVLGEVDLGGLELPSLGEGLESGEIGGQSPFTAAQLELAKSFCSIGGVLLIVVVVALTLYRLRARAGRLRGDERESVWDSFNLRRSLRNLLREGRDRLNQATELGRSRLNRFLAGLTIRRTYALMCALAADDGYPRPAHETPYEYRPTLGRAFPGCEDEVFLITEAYIAVHYGEVPEDPAELDGVRAAWDRIRETSAQGKAAPD